MFAYKLVYQGFFSFIALLRTIKNMVPNATVVMAVRVIPMISAIPIMFTCSCPGKRNSNICAYRKGTKYKQENQKVVVLDSLPARNYCINTRTGTKDKRC